MIRISSKGGDVIAARIKATEDRIKNNLSDALMKGGLAVERTAVDDYLSGPRPSKLDRVSGELAGSVNTVPLSDMEVSVGTNKTYGPPHEFGSSRLPARPFLRPALEDNRDDIIKLVKAAIKG